MSQHSSLYTSSGSSSSNSSSSQGYCICDWFHQKFFISMVDLDRLKAIVFMMEFLVVMIFLMKKDCVDINLLHMVIFIFKGRVRVSDHQTHDLCRNISIIIPQLYRI